MSDRVTVDQQRREEQNAMALNRDGSPVLEKFIRTGKWIQNNGGELKSSLGNRQWLNSNQKAGEVAPVRTRCSRAPGNGTSPSSADSTT